MAKDIAMGCPMIIEESTLTPVKGSMTKSTYGGTKVPPGKFTVDIDYAKMNHSSNHNDGQMATLNQSNPHETGKVKAKHNSPKGY